MQFSIQMEITMKRRILVVAIVVGLATQLAGFTVYQQQQSVAAEEQSRPTLEEQEFNLQMYAGGLDL